MTKRRKRLYFDYAATTPVDPRVMRVMLPYFGIRFGNAGALHSFGQEALLAVDRAREAAAHAIGAVFRQVIFTGSATEANNLALRGAIRRWKMTHPGIPRIIVSSIEHASVLETARDLSGDGVDVVLLPVTKAGVMDVRALQSLLNKNTVLVSVMYVNNEVGTVQPISEIARIIGAFRVERQALSVKNHPTLYPILHTDAVQAFQFFDCNVEKLGVDLLSLSAHKIYGPKGIGMLYARDTAMLAPSITGGGQEFMLRSGTENVPLIAGFGEALRLAVQDRTRTAKYVSSLGGYFWRKLKRICPEAFLNGHSHKNGSNAPHILNVYFPGRDAEELLMKLDMAGIAVSAGSACGTRAHAPSHVLAEMGIAEKCIQQSLRWSFGKYSTRKEVDDALRIIKIILKK